MTDEEEAENRHFLDVVMETTVMKAAHEWLVSKGLANEDPEDFKEKLYKIWFKLYYRLKEDRYGILNYSL